MKYHVIERKMKNNVYKKKIKDNINERRIKKYLIKQKNVNLNKKMLFKN